MGLDGLMAFIEGKPVKKIERIPMVVEEAVENVERGLEEK